jgi:FAD/FMN-containing dehydrogenase
MCALDRRTWLKGALAAPLVGGVPVRAALAAVLDGPTMRRVRPDELGWPSKQQWDALNNAVGGHLLKVESPFAACAQSPASTACADIFGQLKNPYFISESAALPQTSGYLDAWTSSPSVYALNATSARDVARAVNFARRHRLRLVVKGGGHSYQGTSNAADSLLIWTHAMHEVTLHDAFIGEGCEGRQPAQPAVTVEAGALWSHVYDAVTTRAGRYVQGGGCITVGVAGLVQGGGFGNFSKRFGTAAASLLQAEVVTADGAVRIANPCSNPDLFWGLKGGGGGSLGVITRLTLKTHDLPEQFGAVFGAVGASSDAAFKRLTSEFMRFYASRLFNPHWGETVSFRGNNTLNISMVFQGLNEDQAAGVWQPFFDWIAKSPSDFYMPKAAKIIAVPAQRFWDPAFMEAFAPGVMAADNRTGASPGNVFWSADAAEAGQFLYGYHSTWLPASLLDEGERARCVDALFASTRDWGVTLHFNKGLAGASDDARTATRDTAMNPAVLDAFALAIISGEGPPALPGIAGHEPDIRVARHAASRIAKATATLRTVVPRAGSYVSESDFFERDWQDAFWGVHYPRLLAIKRRYDPDGLFFVHHGVNSEEWSDDGFTRLRA